MFAMHARHGLMFKPRVVDLAGRISIHANPVHLARKTCDLLLTNHGNVVLGLTSNRARAAADAPAKIDNHSPRVSAVFKFFRIVKRFLVCGSVFRSRDLFWIGNEFRQSAAAKKIAAFHVVMMLRGGERMFLARLANRQTITEPQRIRRPHRIRVEPGALADASYLRAPITKMQRHRILRLPRLNPNRCFHFSSAKRQLRHVAIIDLFPRRQGRTNNRCIFPGQFRERPW